MEAKRTQRPLLCSASLHPIIKVAFDLCSAMCSLYYEDSAMEPKNLESVPRGHILFYKARCSDFFLGGGHLFFILQAGFM